MTENWQEAGFGLYVHWPFCAAKCPYCDFNSHVSDRVDHARWATALQRDLRYWAERTPGRRLSTIFFGGGTPSMMAPETLAAVIEAARGLWTPANDLEVTMEANPTSVEADRFAAFADAGVNRLSLGLQALDDGALRRLGRQHDVREGLAALEVSKSVVDRVSFDLIYARQDQTAKAWETELRQALDLAGEHLSLYQLTIEPGTVFARRAAVGKLRGLPDEDRAVDLWNITQDLCAAAGLTRYETSNHARPGTEARHNLIYWRGGDWLGVGPGAHGRLSFGTARLATVAHRAPGTWLDRNETTGSGTESEDALPPAEVAEEYLLMGLRTRDGIDLGRLRRLGGDVDASSLGRMVELGMVSTSGDRLRTTEAGALLLDAILAELSPIEP
ncbi:radical SAM family heme chaperone HemW [Jannaschia marina]|uniref:radical SAM family heme chaperone HemW n=1 Tax=Jannaschia marina TaxID=2741674 RepID=UPI002E2E7937|nr:radical SAM family heme chaperone HemW [Jannaschia marina]